MEREHAIHQLKKGLNDPGLVVNKAHHLFDTAVHRTNDRYFERRYGTGSDFMDRDWDNLVILDACRYDYFSKLNTIDGELTRAISKGSNSWEFMSNNFVDRNHHDTVYVTANPHVNRLSGDVFYEVDNVLDQWNEDVGTVLPNVVARRGLEAFHRHPHKRHVVHFMQPHRPYLGPTADRIRESIELSGHAYYRADDGSREKKDGVRWWTAVNQGRISREETLRAYQETLEIVLEEVEHLVDELEGRTVITADHGEMLGERVLSVSKPYYGHSRGYLTPELRFVPWLTIDDGHEREIIEEEPEGTTKMDDEVVNDRLVALGYAPDPS